VDFSGGVRGPVGGLGYPSSDGMSALAYAFPRVKDISLRHCDLCGKNISKGNKAGRCMVCQEVCGCGGRKNRYSNQCWDCSSIRQRATKKRLTIPTGLHCPRCDDEIERERTICLICECEIKRQLLREQGSSAFVIDRFRNHHSGPMRSYHLDHLQP